MSQHNISEININNYTNLDDEFYTIEWFIDKTPDYNLINNTQFVGRIYGGVSNQVLYLTESTMNNTTEDEFIPFDSKKFERISIQNKICQILVSEEERKCCICYETKEYEDISQINCSHKFCGTCIIDHISINYKNPCCPLCREKINRITFQRGFYEDDFQNFT
jgi:hypothetical protein